MTTMVTFDMKVKLNIALYITPRQESVKLCLVSACTFSSMKPRFWFYDSIYFYTNYYTNTLVATLTNLTVLLK